MQSRACFSKVPETFRAQKDVLCLYLHSDKDQRFKGAPGARLKRFSKGPAAFRAQRQILKFKPVK